MDDIARDHHRWILLVLGILLICLAGHLIHDLHPEHGTGCQALHMAVILVLVVLLPPGGIPTRDNHHRKQFRKMLLQSIQTPPPILCGE